MKKVSDISILKKYIEKHKISNIFDDEIIEIAELHHYSYGEYILRSDSKLKYYYLLVSGKVRISYPFEKGNLLLIESNDGFNSLGDLELFDNVSIKCDVQAIEECYLIAVRTTILRKHHMGNQKLLQHVISSLSTKLHNTIESNVYKLPHPLINRVSSYLLEHLKGKDYVNLNAPIKEIAQFFGTTYRSLNKTLKEMESKEIINCKGKKVHILNLEALKELSKK